MKVAKNEFCVFEYQYRDAGNWKTFGSLLLSGQVGNAKVEITRYLEPGGLFVAEQVGVPSLCETHFIDHQDGPSDLDHAYHEFIDIRVATHDEIANLNLVGSLQDLVGRIQATMGRWDVTLSPNCDI